MLITYKIPTAGTEIEVEVRVTWNEKDQMLKLSLPLGFTAEKTYGQTAFGFHDLPMNGNEVTLQKWLTINAKTEDTALRVIDDGIYGCDATNNELRLSLLRSSAYSAHPIQDRDIVLQNRFTLRIDQGERIFKFWINGGSIKKINENAEKDALTKNETPIALSFFPGGHGIPVSQGPVLDGDSSIVISACKKAKNDDGLIIRLYNASASAAQTKLTIPGANISAGTITFTPFEVKTFKVDLLKGKLHECDMMERG